jgi:membrane-bound lytic murein transglycosylase D
MKKLQFFTLFITISSLAFATGNDSLRAKHSRVKMNVLIDNLTDSESESTIDKTDAIKEEVEVVYSEDIMNFEFGEIPVDQDLFLYHTSKLEFMIPMEFNSYVKTQIDYFGVNWQSGLKRMATKSAVYFPIYEKILDQHEMPLELKYLSIIESALNPMARSRSGAMGPWQFMPATGKMFHLDINYQVDERRSVEKSTDAACQYLKQMYNQFGDWYVAIASYNCGPGNVRKAIRLSGSTDFWGMYNYLPRETQNYVPKFIAMAYLMNFYDEFGITPAPMDIDAMMYERVHCDGGMKFEIIAEKLGLSNEELLSVNPELKNAYIPYNNGEYTLNIPSSRVDMFYENSDEIKLISQALIEATPEPPATKEVYYTVRKGDCLPIIARKYGCSVSELKSWNKLKSSTIYPNQKLKIIKS